MVHRQATSFIDYSALLTTSFIDYSALLTTSFIDYSGILLGHGPQVSGATRQKDPKRLPVLGPLAREATRGEAWREPEEGRGKIRHRVRGPCARARKRICQAPPRGGVREAWLHSEEQNAMCDITTITTQATQAYRTPAHTGRRPQTATITTQRRLLSRRVAWQQGIIRPRGAAANYPLLLG